MAQERNNLNVDYTRQKSAVKRRNANTTTKPNRRLTLMKVSGMLVLALTVGSFISLFHFAGAQSVGTNGNVRNSAAGDTTLPPASVDYDNITTITNTNPETAAVEDSNNFTKTVTVSMSNAFEQQRYDGWDNNLGHPDWGSTEAHLTRKTPPSYADGVYTMSGGNRPSPRQLSQAFMKGLDGLGSLRNRTALQTFFGQVGTLLYFNFRGP